MMRGRSGHFMRWGWVIAGVTALALAACARSSGERAEHFVNADIGQAYIPLEGSAYLIMEGHGAAVVIAPNIAATNAHNENLIESKSIIGASRNYDLLYFRTPRSVVPAIAAPAVNERVLAYGQGTDGELRVAQGVVRWLDAEVVARCPGCPVQHAFIFEANAGPGFSGGPVVDAQTGDLVGIVFGFRDDDKDGVEKLMYAYDMSRVQSEFAAMRAK